MTPLKEITGLVCPFSIKWGESPQHGRLAHLLEPSGRKKPHHPLSDQPRYEWRGGMDPGDDRNGRAGRGVAWEDSLGRE